MRRLLERFRHSIAFRITGVFIMLLVFSTTGMVLVLRMYMQQDLQDATRGNLLGAMGRLESELFQLRHELSLFADLSARTTILQAQAQDRGGTAVQINLVEKSRERGIEVNSYMRGGDIPASGILDRAFAGLSTVDFAIIGEGPGRVHLIAAAPAGSSGEEHRVSTSSISLGREFLRQKRASLGSDVTIATKGEVVASSSTCQECFECLGKILQDPRQWDVLEEGKSIYFTFACTPASQAAVAFPIRTFDGRTAVMVMTRSRADEEKALYHATLGVTGGAVAFSIAMGAAFFLLTARALRPLTELTRITGMISEGRYGDTVPVAGKGEVADLAQAFNRMSASLKQAMEEISAWNRLLEKRVEEKSEELEKIHVQMVEVEKLAAMGQLAAGVAHELNNPLSGIMGYSEIALELFRNRPPENITPQEAAKMVSYFANIESLSQRCKAIILDMLKFARQHTEEFHEVNVSETMRQTLMFLDKQLSRSGIKPVVVLLEDLPLIRGNGLQMQQVFTNLILNAAQAMPGGGILEISTRRQGNSVEAEFVDHGTGIEPHNLHRIFEPFFTTKPVGEGTGLGLSVSYGIIKHHGGNIRVSSTLGKGSTFTVILPLPAKG